MLKVINEDGAGTFSEEGTFLHWAFYSIAYALKIKNTKTQEYTSDEEISKEVKNILISLTERINGNRPETNELNETDFDYLYDAVIEQCQKIRNF